MTNVDEAKVSAEMHAGGAASSGGSSAPVTIGFGSCLQPKFRSLGGFYSMMREKPDVVVLLGDQVYLDIEPGELELELFSVACQCVTVRWSSVHVCSHCLAVAFLDWTAQPGTGPNMCYLGH